MCCYLFFTNFSLPLSFSHSFFLTFFLFLSLSMFPMTFKRNTKYKCCNLDIFLLYHGYPVNGWLEGGSQQYRQSHFPKNGLQVNKVAGRDLQNGELRLQDPKDLVQTLRLSSQVRYERATTQRANDPKKRISSHLRAQRFIGPQQGRWRLPQYLQIPQIKEYQQLQHVHFHQQGWYRPHSTWRTKRISDQTEEEDWIRRCGCQGDWVLLHLNQRLFDLLGF